MPSPFEVYSNAHRVLYLWIFTCTLDVQWNIQKALPGVVSTSTRRPLRCCGYFCASSVRFGFIAMTRWGLLWVQFTGLFSCIYNTTRWMVKPLLSIQLGIVTFFRVTGRMLGFVKFFFTLWKSWIVFSYILPNCHYKRMFPLHCALK